MSPVPLSGALVIALLSVMTACTSAMAPAPNDTAERSGTIELNQASTNDNPPGGGGRGTLLFHNALYSFAIGGLGVEGSAVAIVQTEGRAYQLRSISMFPGTYHRAPPGTQLPAQAGTDLWLQNEHGTLIRLMPPPQGRLPDIDGDAVHIVLEAIPS